MSHSIFEISDNELLVRYSRIKPIVKINGIKYWLREFSLKELRDTPFLSHRKLNKSNPVNVFALKAIPDYDFVCYHTYSWPTFFVPTIAEGLLRFRKKYFLWFQLLKS